MYEFFKKRNELLYKWSYLGLICFILWQGVYRYSISYSSEYSDEKSGKTYAELYKEKTYYISLSEYFLIRALPVCGFLIIIILSICERIQSKKEIENCFTQK